MPLAPQLNQASTRWYLLTSYVTVVARSVYQAASRVLRLPLRSFTVQAEEPTQTTITRQ